MDRCPICFEELEEETEVYNCPFCKAHYHFLCWESYGKNICAICRSASILIPKQITRKYLIDLIKENRDAQLIVSRLNRTHERLKLLLEQLKHPKQLASIFNDYIEAIKSIRNIDYKPMFKTCIRSKDYGFGHVNDIKNKEEKHMRIYQDCIRNGFLFDKAIVEVSHPYQIIFPFMEGYILLGRAAAGEDMRELVSKIIRTAMRRKAVESYLHLIKELVHSKTTVGANMVIYISERGKPLCPCAAPGCNGWLSSVTVSQNDDGVAQQTDTESGANADDGVVSQAEADSQADDESGTNVDTHVDSQTDADDGVAQQTDDGVDSQNGICEKIICSRCLSPVKPKEIFPPESYCLKCRQTGIIKREEKVADLYQSLILLPYDILKKETVEINYCPHCHYTYVIVAIFDAITHRNSLGTFNLGIPDDLRTDEMNDEIKRTYAYIMGPKFISKLTDNELLIDISRKAVIDIAELENLVVDMTLEQKTKTWSLPFEVLKPLAIFSLLHKYHNCYLDAIRKNEETPAVKQLSEFIEKILKSKERKRRNASEPSLEAKRPPR